MLPLYIFGLDVSINYGKEAKQHFSVLNINHKEALECTEEYNAQGDVLRVICTLDRTPIASFSPTETLFFRFWSRVVDGRFFLYIEPKHKIKLYATPSDLKSNAPITKEQPKISKTWQVIGYENEIPFLNDYNDQSKPRGLNFPIKIIRNDELYVNDLDINRGPLNYEEGEDYEAYSHIQTLMKNHSHIEAVKAIDETLNAYPKTIFAKDLLLFRLRALEHFDAVENSDMIVDMGTKWVKKYPTDSGVPEVLYYLGNAYADLRIPQEAKYYFDRIISEYPNSRYTPLAKMALAKNFNAGADESAASKLFAQAYQEAKDLDSASAIAIEWSKFRIQNNEKAQAQKLLETMLKVNPSYITKYPIKSYEFLKLLAEHEMYLIAAQLGEYFYENLPNDDISAEDLLNNVSLWYQASGSTQDAHRINKAFLQEFEHRPKSEEVRERDDKLLFNLAEDENTDSKIAKYDYIIQNYPHGPEQEKALALKVQALFDAKKYKEVIALKDTLKDETLIEKSYVALLEDSIEKGDCKQVSGYYLALKSPLQALQEKQKMPLFDCMYSLSLNKEAAQISQDMAQNATKLEDKLAWLYRDAQNFAKLGDSKSAARAGRDALALAQSLKSSDYYDVGFPLFNALHALDNKDEVLQVYTFLKENIPNHPQMLSVDLMLLKDSQNQSDDVGIEIYAKDILRLQNLQGVDSQSPYVDFALAQSYIRTQRNIEAINTLNDLLKKEISDDDKQKTLYLKGSLLKSMQDSQKSEINESAQQSFESCVAIPYNGAWQNLCKQALDILKGVP